MNANKANQLGSSLCSAQLFAALNTMKQIPEFLNMLSLKYSSIEKPVLFLLLASLVGLVGLYFFGRETDPIHALTIFLTYVLF
jgi:hypothetical protein